MFPQSKVLFFICLPLFLKQPHEIQAVGKTVLESITACQHFLVIILCSLMPLNSEIYGDTQILEVQIAFNFKKLKEAQRKVLAAQMGRQHCEEQLQKTGERPLTVVSTNKLSPCCQCCGASHVDGIEYFTEEEEDGKTEADMQRQKLKSLGIAFVTFENAKVVDR